jgi:hypothetical protein
MRKIMVSEPVWAAIVERGKFGEQADDVLRRVFEIPSARPTGKAKTKFATKTVSPWIEKGQLHILFDDGPLSWKLPKKSDRLAIARVRSAAHVEARNRGATEGQLNAMTKRLNEQGYYSRFARRNGLDDG